MVWTQTAGGIAFTPLDPQPSDVRLIDLAHSLSLQCRFNGHCRYPYSVAQHSVYVAAALPDHLKVYGIIHDAAEAYVGDLVAPIKGVFPSFRELEDRVQEAICAAVGLPWPWPADVQAAVKHADLAVLAAERDQVMAPSPRPWADLPPPPPDLIIEPWTWEQARRSWLHVARSLLPNGGMYVG